MAGSLWKDSFSYWSSVAHPAATARATPAGAGPQEVSTNAGVCAQDVRQVGDISSNHLAHLGQGVDVGQFGGQETVRGVLGQFGGSWVRDDHLGSYGVVQCGHFLGGGAARAGRGRQAQEDDVRGGHGRLASGVERECAAVQSSEQQGAYVGLGQVGSAGSQRLDRGGVVVDAGDRVTERGQTCAGGLSPT